MAKKELAFISRNKDGNIIYDFNKFNSIDEAILEEWKFSSNSLFDNASLEEIADIIYDKNLIIKNNGKHGYKRWEKFIHDLNMRLRELDKTKNESCVCEKILSNLDENYCSSEVIGNDGHWTALHMCLDYFNNTGELLWSIQATGDDTSSTSIQYCPFCGKKLPRTLK